MNPERIFEAFPAPTYRGNQEQALRDIRDAFAAGNDVVLVRAPTGSGKSLLARAVAGCARTVEEPSRVKRRGVLHDAAGLTTGRCGVGRPALGSERHPREVELQLHPPGGAKHAGQSGPCVRERGYDCSVKHRCPYFSDRAIASNREIAAMTLAYFMQTAGSEVFRRRDVVVIDEAHGLAEWAEMYATIQLGPRTVPFWDELRVPEVDRVERAVRYAENLAQTCGRRKDDLLAQEALSPAEVRERDRLQELIGELEWFVSDYRDPESPTTWLVDQSEPAGSARGRDGDGSEGDDREGEDDTGGPLTIKPMNPRSTSPTPSGTAETSSPCCRRRF